MTNIGGGAVTGEIHPGFRCPTSSTKWSCSSAIVHDRIWSAWSRAAHAPAQVCSLSPAGTLVIAADPARTQQSIKGFSAKDAEAFPLFQAALQRTASVLASAFEYVPPSIVKPAPHLWNLLKTARAFRALGKRDAIVCCAGGRCQWPI